MRKILVFRLQGKMAHFRRYYTNSTALSYWVPPRTTVVGIIAGLMGWSRNSYYEVFSLGRCRIALQTVFPLKKQIQKLNLLMVKSSNDLNGSQKYHSQTPTELVIPQNIRDEILDYRVWLSHNDGNIMKQLENLLEDRRPVYQSRGISLGLGVASHLGWTVFDGTVDGEEINDTEIVPISSIVPINLIQDIDVAAGERAYRLVREELPLEFDSKRRITERGKGDMVINLSGRPIWARVSAALRLGDGNYITWME